VIKVNCVIYIYVYVELGSTGSQGTTDWQRETGRSRAIRYPQKLVVALRDATWISCTWLNAEYQTQSPVNWSLMNIPLNTAVPYPLLCLSL